MSLSRRLSLHFALLLAACCAGTAWLQTRFNARQQQRVEQRLLLRLAEHVATEARGLGSGPLDEARLAAVAQRLAATNPAVDLYLLDGAGRVTMRKATPMPLLVPQVDLVPVREFLEGAALPLFGTDPAAPGVQKVFSVARVIRPDARPGFLYAVLQGSQFDAAARDAVSDGALHATAWAVAWVALLGAIAAVAVFRWVTQPLQRLRRDALLLERASRLSGDTEDDPGAPMRDEIEQLRRAFGRLSQSTESRWSRLARQDEQRRALVAGISAELRTPLALLHGYLESLALRAATMSPSRRDGLLRMALTQSLRVSRLAGDLLELARLELGATRPKPEAFALDELAQDVLEKMTLAAPAGAPRIELQVAAGLPAVDADIGMIERVLSCLLDRAMRPTPPGGNPRLQLGVAAGRVSVVLVDDRPGLPPATEGDALALSIVRRILELHGSELRTRPSPHGGTEVAFSLASAG